VKLQIEFAPTSTPEQQTLFFQQNEIKFVGSNAPPSALSWAELPLPDTIRRVISKNEWTEPTPIQSIAIPVALRGTDLIGIA
jgi:superfamily II DNA/RNA helicase